MLINDIDEKNKRNVIGRYSVEAKTLLIICPFCKHVSHVKINGDSIKVKDYRGAFSCYGGLNLETNEYDKCDEILNIVRIV